MKMKNKIYIIYHASMNARVYCLGLEMKKIYLIVKILLFNEGLFCICTLKTIFTITSFIATSALPLPIIT